MLVSTSGCWRLHLDARRHLWVDAAAARLRHLPSDARPSLGSGVRHDPALQAERDGAIVPQFPHLSVGIPRAAGLLHLLTQDELGKLLLDGNAVICDWMPVSSGGCEYLYLDAAWASAWRFSPLDLGHRLLDAGASTIRLFRPRPTTRS